MNRLSFQVFILTSKFLLLTGLKINFRQFSHFASLGSRVTSLQGSNSRVDSELWKNIDSEWTRQVNSLELIASENYVSSEVLDALGSCLTNKYSEGLPGLRYYGGNQHIDQIESLCQRRALSLFGLNDTEWSVNVQPYSGSIANFAVYSALVQPGGRLMGLDLPAGGHLSHGYQTAKRKVSASSMFFESRSYGVHPSSGLIDYDALEISARQFRPALIVAGASAYPRDWDYVRMKEISDSVGSLLMADMAHISGLVATGLCSNPFSVCDVVTTTTQKSLRGPRSAIIFSRKRHERAINNAVFPGLQGGPHNNQIAAVAVALREAADPSYLRYMTQVQANARALAAELIQLGYSVVTNGTDNHLVLVDLRSTGVSASLVEAACELCDISVNKNSLPGDTSALHPGGIRLGTLAMTTRGMLEADMVAIAGVLDEVMRLAGAVTSAVNTTQGEAGQKKDKDSYMKQLLETDQWSSELHRIKRRVNQMCSSLSIPGRSS